MSLTTTKTLKIKVMVLKIIYNKLREPLPKPKTIIPNLDFHKSFCSKRYSKSKKDI